MYEVRVVKFCVVVSYIQLLAIAQLTVPERGVVKVTWPLLEFYIPWYIFGTTKAADFKFCARFRHEKY